MHKVETGEARNFIMQLNALALYELSNSRVKNLTLKQRKFVQSNLLNIFQPYLLKKTGQKWFFLVYVAVQCQSLKRQIVMEWMPYFLCYHHAVMSSQLLSSNCNESSIVHQIFSFVCYQLCGSTYPPFSHPPFVDFLQLAPGTSVVESAVNIFPDGGFVDGRGILSSGGGGADAAKCCRISMEFTWGAIQYSPENCPQKCPEKPFKKYS